jgi:hypothetical protein
MSPLSCGWVCALLLSLPQPYVRPQTGGQPDEGFRSLFGCGLTGLCNRAAVYVMNFGSAAANTSTARRTFRGR